MRLFVVFIFGAVLLGTAARRQRIELPRSHKIINLLLSRAARFIKKEKAKDTLASVYGALAFHYDNEAAINEAIRQARELGEQLGARSIQSAIKEMKRRKKSS